MIMSPLCGLRWLWRAFFFYPNFAVMRHDIKHSGGFDIIHTLKGVSYPLPRVLTRGFGFHERKKRCTQRRLIER